MQENRISTVISNVCVTSDTFLLQIDFPAEPMPGQFLMLTKPDGLLDPFLPRPISVFDWQEGVLSLLIRIVGKGTRVLSGLKSGDKIRIVGYLGNSFPDSTGKMLFIGGGIGVAPLFYAAKVASAKEKSFILGFKNRGSVLMAERFSGLGRLTVTTDDGSFGIHTFPHLVLKEQLETGDIPDVICTCGPKVMMNCVAETVRDYPGIALYQSYESRMACGIGACLGCRISTPGGSYLVCKEGPVFKV